MNKQPTTEYVTLVRTYLSFRPVLRTGYKRVRARGRSTKESGEADTCRAEVLLREVLLDGPRQKRQRGWVLRSPVSLPRNRGLPVATEFLVQHLPPKKQKPIVVNDRSRVSCF